MIFHKIKIEIIVFICKIQMNSTNNIIDEKFTYELKWMIIE